MNFTYESYFNLIERLRNCGYILSSYKDYPLNGQCAILRHDVDYSLRKALQLAEKENVGGVKSTYFIMITNEFYNVFSREGEGILRTITSLGHTIGLHFDEARYPNDVGNPDSVIKKIRYEADILARVTEKPVEMMSMHRPSRNIIDANLKIPGIINTYGEEFFRNFKYLSDSRRRWREPIEEIIEQRKEKRIQILVHPFWYGEEEIDMKTSIIEFVNGANKERYMNFMDNFSDLSDVMALSEVKV